MDIYTVSKKGVKPLIFPTILYNILFFLMICMAALDEQKEAKYFMYVTIGFFIVFNITLFYLYIQCLSKVIFNSDNVKCIFMKRNRRTISYNEIVEYGVIWNRVAKYVYISKIELSKIQREEKTFDLYRKTKNMIVLEYSEEVINFIRCKIEKEEISCKEYIF